MSSLTIGIPAFFLALAPGGGRAQQGFVRRVLRFAAPAGLVAAAATFAGYALARSQDGTSLGEAPTTATIVLLLVGLEILLILARPLTAVGIAAFADSLLEAGWQLVDWVLHRAGPSTPAIRTSGTAKPGDRARRS